MSTKLNHWFTPFARFAALVAALALLAAGSAQATTEYATGTFTWDNSSTAAWSTTSGGSPPGTYSSTWTSGNDAVFEGTAGTVSIGAGGATAHNLNFNTTDYLIQNNTLTLNGTTPTLSLGTSINGTISSIVAGSAGLTKSSAGVLTLSGPNTYGGTTTVSGGQLLMTGAYTGNGKFTVSGGANLTFNSPGNTFTFNSTGFADNNVGYGTTGSFTLTAGTVNLNGAGGNLGLGVGSGGNGDGTLTINGGTLNLAWWLLMGRNGSPNTATLTINGGQVNVNGLIYLGNSSPGCFINLNSGGTLAMTYAQDGTAGSFNFNGGTLKAKQTTTTFFSGTALPLVVSTNGAIIDDSGFAITIPKALTHDSTLGSTPDGGLTKVGAGTLTLSTASSTYTGGTTNSAGKLAVGVNNALPTGTTVTFGTATTDATLDLGGYNQQVGGLAVGSGATAANQIITNSSAANNSTLTFSGGTSSFGGTIKDGSSKTVALAMSGGALTLTGNNTYSGGTTFLGGTLRVNGQTGANSGTGSGQVVVTSGTLSGNGQVVGDVTVGNGASAVLYPNNGASGGTLTLGGNLTFSGSSSGVEFDLSSTYNGNNDHVVLGGSSKTLTCGGAQIAINCGATLDQGTDYVLFDAGVTGTISGSFNATPTFPGTTPAGAANFSIRTGTRYVTLHYTTPSTATKLAYTTVPSVGTVGAAFTVVVQSQDASGNASSPSSPTTVTLSRVTGSGSLGGTFSGVIPTTGNPSVTLAPTYSASGAMSLKAAATAGMTSLTPVTNSITFTEALDWAGDSGNWTDTGAWYDPNTSASATYANGDTVLLEDTHSGTSPITITLDTAVTPRGVTANSTKDFTITGAGAIGGSTSLTNAGAGSLTLGGTNTYTGGTTLSAGQLNINNTQALGTSAGTFTISGGTIDNTSGSDITTVNYPQAWNANVTYAGSANNLSLGAGAVTLGAHRTVTVNGSILTVGGNIGDGGYGWSLTKAGTGALALAGTSTYTGGTTLGAGQLDINSAQALGTAAGTFTINGGTLDNTSGGDVTTVNYPQTWNASFGYAGSANNLNLGVGAVALGANPTVTVTANTLTVGGPISGNHSLTTAGAGTLTLGGTNTYNGTTTVGGGTLLVTGALTGGGIFVADNGGNLAFNAPGKTSTFNNTGFDSIHIGTGSTGSLALTNGTVNVTGAGNPLGLDVGVANGNGTLTVAGGTLNVAGRILMAANNPSSHATLNFNGGQVNIGYQGGNTGYNGLWYGSGTTTVNLNGGTLATYCCLGGGGASSFNFNGGALKALANNSAFLNSVTLPVYVYPSGAIIDDSGFAITILPPLSDAGGGLTKLGAGTLTLAGACTYSGPTDISNGTLVVDGSVGGSLGGSGAVTVEPGATLSAKGSASVAGLVTLPTGNGAINLTNGTLDTLTLSGGLGLNNGNLLAFDIGGAGWDQIAVGGAFTQRGTATIALNQLPGLDTGTYNLITGASGISSGAFTLSATSTNYSLSLTNPDSSTLALVVQALVPPVPLAAFWHNRSGTVWNVATNWDTDASSNIAAGQPPGDPSAVTFAANGASLFSTTLGADFSILSLTLSTPSDVAIGGDNVLTLNGPLTVSPGAGSSNSISAAAVTLGTNQAWTVTDPGSTLWVSSPVGGTAALTNAGAGTVVLAGTNTYTGQTTVSGGGTLLVNGALTGGGRFLVNDGSLLVFNDAGNTNTFHTADYASSVGIGTSDGHISNIGSLTLSNGTVNVTGGGNNNGLNLGVSSGSGVPPQGTLTVSGGTLNVAGRLLMAANQTTAQGTLTLNGGRINLGYLGGYTVNQQGTLYMGGGNGTVNLNGGTLAMYCAPDGGPRSTFNLNGGTLKAVADNATFLGSVTLPVYVYPGGAIIDDGGFAITITASLSDAGGGLTKLGPGTLTLTGLNTYSGATLVQNGVLACESTDSLATGALSISSGAVLQLDYFGSQTVATLTLNGAQQAAGIYGSSISGATYTNNTYFAGTGTVTVTSGGGTLTPPELDPSGFTMPGGVPSFTFTTESGFKYRMVYSEDVAAPLSGWLPVIDEPNFPPSDGWSIIPGGSPMSLSDTNAVGVPQRFYRLEKATP